VTHCEECAAANDYEGYTGNEMRVMLLRESVLCLTYVVDDLGLVAKSSFFCDPVKVGLDLLGVPSMQTVPAMTWKLTRSKSNFWK
jgi:hypothetical protein